MSKFVKGLMQKEYSHKFDGVSDFVVICTDGVSGNDNNMLRGELSKKGMRLTVVKNTLMRLAVKELGLSSADELFGNGPCTVVFGGDSVVDVAKETVTWAKKIKAIELKGAYAEGATFDGKGVEVLSKMPSRAELQGTIVSIACAPGAKVAGAIMAPASCIAGCLKTIIEKAEKAA